MPPPDDRTQAIARSLHEVRMRSMPDGPARDRERMRGSYGEDYDLAPMFSDALDELGFTIVLKDDILRIEELDALFDLQWKRMREATVAWQAAHPGNDLVWPDLGALLAWLLESRAALVEAYGAMKAATEWAAHQVPVGPDRSPDAIREHLAGYDALLAATVKAGVVTGDLKERI